MAEKPQLDRVWEVIDKVGICMMTTRFSEGLRSRPLKARPDRDEDTIWFLTDRRGAKDDEIEDHPAICLTFVYPKEKVYLSISGSASIARDTERARQLWNDEQQAWWPGGPSDQNVLVVRFQPERPRFGTAQRVRRLPPSNSLGREQQVQGQSSARTGKAP